MPLALPAPTPLAAPTGAPVPTLVRHDDTAARDFAALLGAMLTPTHADATRPNVKLTLDALADAAITAQGDETDATTVADEQSPAAGSADAAATANTARDTPNLPPDRTTRNAAATRSTEAANERRRATAAAQASARAMMEESIASTSAAITGATTATQASWIAATAGATAGATAAAPMITGTETLDADFSARLERVIDRMRKAGHTVEVRETLRSPERQQALYAQGRTAGGPVVTWTLDSRHLEGKAADVRVDGSATGRAYDLLHAIAAEEGLRTLGARDPGHLELPRTTADAREGAAARRGAELPGTWDRGATTTATVVAPGGIARVARVAEVAAIAQVAVPGTRATGARRTALATDGAAGVVADAATRTARTRIAGRPGALPALRPHDASVVTVAKAESPAVTLGPDAAQRASAARDAANATVPADGTAVAPAAVAVPSGRASQQGTGAQGNDAQGGGSRGAAAQDAAAQEQDEARTARPTRARTNGLGIGDAMPRLHTDTTSSHAMPGAHARHASGGAGAPITAPGSLAAERVADLLAARDAQPAGTLGELRLAMDPARDGLSEVRLAMQHGALDATLRTGDAGVARGLQAEVATLTRSLERQGFDAARVTVQLDAAQQARSAALDTVAASEATARERGLRGDSDASLEGRDQHTPHHSQQQTAHDAQRDRQYARQFGPRRQRTS